MYAVLFLVFFSECGFGRMTAAVAYISRLVSAMMLVIISSMGLLVSSVYCMLSL